eukprot:Skav211757  [mRNA]  locus=scaffold674:61837:67089:- [translate_table: standard]
MQTTPNVRSDTKMPRIDMPGPRAAPELVPHGQLLQRSRGRAQGAQLRRHGNEAQHLKEVALGPMGRQGNCQGPMEGPWVACGS